MKFEDIQITRTYPPEVEAQRQKILAILDNIKREIEAKVAALPPMRGHERIIELKRLQALFIEQTRPWSAELCRLENYATITVSKAA